MKARRKKGGRKKDSRKQRGGTDECPTAIYCLIARSNMSDVHLSELGNHSRGHANNVCMWLWAVAESEAATMERLDMRLETTLVSLP